MMHLVVRFPSAPPIFCCRFPSVGSYCSFSVSRHSGTSCAGSDQETGSRACRQVHRVCGSQHRAKVQGHLQGTIKDQLAQSVERLPGLTLRQWWHDRFRFRAPPMPSCRYGEENGLAAMLATKRLAGATSGVNLRECVTGTPLRNVNKAAHSGFETQRRRPKRLSMAHKMDFCPPKMLFFKKKII